MLACECGDYRESLSDEIKYIQSVKYYNFNLCWRCNERNEQHRLKCLDRPNVSDPIFPSYTLDEFLDNVLNLLESRIEDFQKEIVSCFWYLLERIEREYIGESYLYSDLYRASNWAPYTFEEAQKKFIKSVFDRKSLFELVREDCIGDINYDINKSRSITAVSLPSALKLVKPNKKDHGWYNGLEPIRAFIYALSCEDIDEAIVSFRKAYHELYLNSVRINNLRSEQYSKEKVMWSYKMNFWESLFGSGTKRKMVEEIDSLKQKISLEIAQNGDWYYNCLPVWSEATGKFVLVGHGHSLCDAPYEDHITLWIRSIQGGDIVYRGEWLRKKLYLDISFHVSDRFPSFLSERMVSKSTRFSYPGYHLFKED